MSIFIIWQAAYAAALIEVERGLALSDSKEFDDLIMIWPQVEDRLERLPFVDWALLVEPEQEQLGVTIRALQSSLDRLCQAGKRWQGEIFYMLKSLQNNRNLQQSYLR